MPSAAGVELADDLVPGLPQSHPDLCRSVLEPALAGADRKEPVELIGRIYTRERALLVGPDERGASLKFTFGLEPKDNQEKDKKLASLVAAGLDGGTQQQRQALQATEPSLSTLAAAAARVRDAADMKPTLHRRIALEAEWKEVDAFEFSMGLPTPVMLKENESLTASFAYSLEFRRNQERVTDLPAYEFAASYEDVDGDAMRQSRFVASLKAFLRMEELGEYSDLTFGLVYANRPEYLADEEFDEQLSANFGMTFKLGKN